MKSTERHFYGKQNKLKSKKIIDQLFAEGKHITINSLKLIWLAENDLFPLQAGVSVSSKNFKKATDRNRIKRLLRECYRLQKNTIEHYLKTNNKQCSLFLIYTGRTLPDYDTLFDNCGLILNKLLNKLNENNKPNI